MTASGSVSTSTVGGFLGRSSSSGQYVIEFERGHRRGRGILLEDPIEGIVGVVECVDCESKFVLTVKGGHDDPDELATAIDEFMFSHECIS